MHTYPYIIIATDADKMHEHKHAFTATSYIIYIYSE